MKSSYSYPSTERGPPKCRDTPIHASMKDTGGYKMPKSREGKTTLIWLWDAMHVAGFLPSLHSRARDNVCVRACTELHNSAHYSAGAKYINY